jgi:hypothetical protein
LLQPKVYPNTTCALFSYEKIEMSRLANYYLVSSQIGGFVHKDNM